jgi:hypothetical protein
MGSSDGSAGGGVQRHFILAGRPVVTEEAYETVRTRSAVSIAPSCGRPTARHLAPAYKLARTTHYEKDSACPRWSAGDLCPAPLASHSGYVRGDPAWV